MPILMCPPTHYGIEYEINPWMHVTSQVDRPRAQRQWEALLHTYAELGAEVVLADPVAGLPDMVFTANAGLTWGDRVVLSRFRHPERQREESRWRELFESRGAPVCDTGEIAFEGAGDALFVGDTLVCGYGFRTDPAAIPMVAGQLGVEVVAVELVDPRYYHLDTCFCPLDRDTVLFAPAAFSPESQERVRHLARRVIEVPDRVAAGFACNAIADRGRGRLVDRRGGAADAAPGGRLPGAGPPHGRVHEGGGRGALPLPARADTPEAPGVRLSRAPRNADPRCQRPDAGQPESPDCPGRPDGLSRDAGREVSRPCRRRCRATIRGGHRRRASWPRAAWPGGRSGG